MLARGLLGRASAFVPKTSTHDLSQPILVALNAHPAYSRQFLSTARNVLKLYSPRWARSYATVQRTRSAKPKTTTKAKPKAAPKKKAASKTVSKKKAAPKKKKKTVKAKARTAKPRARKPKTDKQIESAEKKKAAEKVRELKALALKEPKGKPSTVWRLVMMEESKKGGPAPDHSKAAKARYDSLDAAEREQLNHTANQNKADNAVAYRAWVESYTPDQTRVANNARISLRKIAKTGVYRLPKFGSLIHDDRHPKQPLVPHLAFYKERFATGDFKAIPVREAATMVYKEYTALPASEKKRYEDDFAAEQKQYAINYKRAFGREPPSYAKAEAATK